jgi:ABC-type phosphate/phosphonate transport system ATPase subunit
MATRRKANVNLSSKIALIVLAVLVSLLSPCENGQREEVGFAIALFESGELILADEHIAAYIWGTNIAFS